MKPKRIAMGILAMAMAAVPAFAFEPLSGAASAEILVHRSAMTCSTGPAEDELLSLINLERTRNHEMPVQMEERLAQAARNHAAEMLRNRQLSHQFPGEVGLSARLARVSVPLDRSAENVTMHYTAAGAHTAFMGSAPHRANILNSDFNAVGIAVLCDSDWLYIVEDFARLIPELPDSEVADRISSQLTNLLEHSRGRVMRVNDRRVDQLAISMASRGTVASSGGLSLPGALCLAGYTTTNPGSLPDGMAQLRSVSGAAQYAVGVHFGRTAKYPHGVYWVLVVVFAQDGSYAAVR
jgi:uncharacterized protein YkwD